MCWVAWALSACLVREKQCTWLNTQWISECINSDYPLHVLAHTCRDTLTIADWLGNGGRLECFDVLPNHDTKNKVIKTLIISQKKYETLNQTIDKFKLKE